MRTPPPLLNSTVNVHAAFKTVPKCPAFVFTGNNKDCIMDNFKITEKFMDSQTDEEKDKLKFALPLTDYYLKMTPSQIADRLAKRKLPDAVKTDTLEAYRREKPKINTANVKARQRRRLWREFTMPLKAEIKTTKVMLKNYMGDERHEALNWYLTELEHQHAKMMKFAEAGVHTPAAIVKGSSTILNDGTHWTDWIPMSRREPIYEKFAAVPKTHRAKTPFERRVPKTLNKKLRERLYTRTQKEMDSHRRQIRLLRMTHTDDEKIEMLEADLGRMTQALEWVKNLGDADAVPTTWHGFFKSGAMRTKYKEMDDGETDVA